MEIFRENLFKNAYAQEFAVKRVLFQEDTGHHHLIIFENELFGRVMALDGIVQTTEKDEFIYHEMLSHVPLFAHGKAQNVLVVGGGDGGILREVARHGGVKRIVHVEIDPAVIEMCRTYFPGHSSGAFDDPRVELVISDGLKYVQETDEKFDVIISDSTDPEGPGEALFTRDFYAGCKRCLDNGGVLVTQNGVCFLQLQEVRDTASHFCELFDDYHFFSAAVPTYVGGIMAFGWATGDPELRRVPRQTLEARYRACGIKTRYYNPAVHVASFALPQYVLDAVDGLAN